MNHPSVGSSKIRDMVLPSSWLYLSKQVLQTFPARQTVEGIRVILAPRAPTANDDEGEPIVVWAPKSLSKILEGCADDFQIEQAKNKNICYLPANKECRLYIDILPQKSFLPTTTKEDEEFYGSSTAIFWNPIVVVVVPTP